MQSDSDILNALSKLGTDLAGNVPVPTIAPLGFTAPTGADLDAKWKEFLTRAQNDPDIVNYYTNILAQAKGDTNLARSFLERDYSMGVRQTTENTKSNLESLGLTFGHETQGLEGDLNKRGIALTDLGGGKVGYAAGGQPQTEVSQLKESQNLRKEAEQRSARQGIEKAGLTREKGLSTTGQNLQYKAQDLQHSKQGDVVGRANTYYDLYKGKVAADLQQKQQAQQSGGGSSDYTDPTMGGFGSFSRPDLSNPFKVQKYNEYKQSQGL